MRFTVKSTTTLILASKSPRRIELMTLAGFDFLSVPAVKEEKITGGTSPSDAVLMLSRQKAEEIAEKYPYNTVIGADTVVALGNEIMGKPENEQDAFDMLKKLSGKTHTVLTGVCVISPDKQINFYEKTEVEFYPLGDDEIRQYIASGEPMDKAGAYGIQEKGAMFVKRINGSNKEIIEISVLCADNDKEKVYGVRNYLPEMLILLTGAFAVLNQPHGYQTSVNNRDYPFFDRKDMSFIKVGEKNEEK